MKDFIYKLLVVALVFGLGYAISSLQSKPKVLGSIGDGFGYNATTTSTGRFTADTVLKSTGGQLGSIVVTGAATGVIELYDATTTAITSRSAAFASSSILVASLPASTAAGTYTFDRELKYGLVISIVGTMPTTTVTYR